MNTPAYQQLSVLLAYCLNGLRTDSYLTGADDLNAEAEDICKIALPYKLFEVGKEGISPYVDLGKAQLPALAIYPESWEDTNDQIGDRGMRCVLGIQYLFTSRASQVSHHREAKAIHFAHAIWWVLRDLLHNPDFVAAGFADAHIKHVASDGVCEMLPPIGYPVRGFVAGAEMFYIWEPWRSSSDAVDFDDCYGTMEERTEPLDPMTVEVGEDGHPWSQE